MARGWMLRAGRAWNLLCLDGFKHFVGPTPRSGSLLPGAPGSQDGRCGDGLGCVDESMDLRFGVIGGEPPTGIALVGGVLDRDADHPASQFTERVEESIIRPTRSSNSSRSAGAIPAWTWARDFRSSAISSGWGGSTTIQKSVLSSVLPRVVSIKRLRAASLRRISDRNWSIASQ